MTQQTSRFTRETPVAELDLFLAENLWVPCPDGPPDHHGRPFNHAEVLTVVGRHMGDPNGQPEYGPHADCQGPGRVWPLRVACKGGMRASVDVGEGQIYSFWIPTPDELIHSGKPFVRQCRTVNRMDWRTDEWVSQCSGRCQGRGWLPSTDIDAQLEAVRQRGGAYSFDVDAEIFEGGAMVTVHLRPGIGTITRKEAQGLPSTFALKLAVCQAVERTTGGRA